MLLVRRPSYPVIALVILLLLTSCQAAPQFAIESDLQLERPLPELVTFLEAYIPEQMKSNHVPGLSIALIREGQVVWKENFGVVNSLTGAPVTDETRFEAASLGKPIAAYGALQLVEQGDLVLDAPLDEYLGRPFLADPQDQNEITLRDVLSHSAGLSNDMQRFDTKLYSPPGQEFRYSGMGFLYAQAVVESVSGAMFDHFMQQSVFEPIGMSDSSFQWQDAWADRVSNGHLTGLNLFAFLSIVYFLLWFVLLIILLFAYALRRRRFLGLRRAGYAVILLFAGVVLIALVSYNITLPLPIAWSQNRSANAASSLYATTDDLAAFMQEFLDPGRQSAIEQKMLEAQIQVDENLYWGNGVGIQRNTEGRISFWQWGSNIDFQGFMVGYPAEQIGVVILTNSSNGLAIVPGIVQHAVGGEQYWWGMLYD